MAGLLRLTPNGASRQNLPESTSFGASHKSAFALAAIGVVELASSVAVADVRQPVDVFELPNRIIDESAEREILGGKNRPGRLVEIRATEGSLTALFTVHGINGSPDGLDPLHGKVKSGVGVSTFVYDDNYRRLDKSASDFANAVAAWQNAHPGARLVIDAHSMGGRVALAGISRLAAGPGIKGPIELNLIASPLGGYDSANGARNAPKFMRGWIKNLRPSQDMGTRSNFQKELERAKLPENVKVTIYVAGKDEVVPAKSSAPQKIVDNLGAKVVHLPGADHNGAINAVAELRAPIQ